MPDNKDRNTERSAISSPGDRQAIQRTYRDFVQKNRSAHDFMNIHLESAASYIRECLVAEAERWLPEFPTYSFIMNNVEPRVWGDHPAIILNSSMENPHVYLMRDGIYTFTQGYAERPLWTSRQHDLSVYLQPSHDDYSVNYGQDALKKIYRESLRQQMVQFDPPPSTTFREVFKEDGLRIEEIKNGRRTHQVYVNLKGNIRINPNRGNSPTINIVDWIEKAHHAISQEKIRREEAE